MKKLDAHQHTTTRWAVAIFAVICLGCGAIMLWVGTQGSPSVKDTGHYFGAVTAFIMGIFALAAVFWDVRRVGDISVSVRGSFAAK